MSEREEPAKSGAREPVRLRPCPICGRPSVQQYHPFCSARCADVDLYRWFSGHYRIPAEEGSSEEAESAEDAGAAAEEADDKADRDRH